MLKLIQKESRTIYILLTRVHKLHGRYYPYCLAQWTRLSKILDHLKNLVRNKNFCFTTKLCCWLQRNTIQYSNFINKTRMNLPKPMFRVSINRNTNSLELISFKATFFITFRRSWLVSKQNTTTEMLSTLNTVQIYSAVFRRKSDIIRLRRRI